MTLRCVFCKKCAEKLTGFGKITYSTYKSICKCYADNQAVFTETGKTGKGGTIINYLELKGFVVTTESDLNYLAIKPIGYKLYKNKHYEFCAFRNSHK